MPKQVTVRDLLAAFKYKQICGNDESLNRVIRDQNTNRPGLELSGYLNENVVTRVVVIGEKETEYIKTMSEERQKQVFDYLTGELIPCIVICRDLPCPPILYDIAFKKNFPIFSSFAPTNTIIVEIVSFLEEYFAATESVHGVLLQVYGKGVLLKGESGIGKSEIALELVKRGHILVADDRVDIMRIHNNLVGESPEVLRHMLELRGVGIIDVTRMFGIYSATDRSQIDFVIELQKWNDGNSFDRIGIDNQQTEVYFGVEVPKTVIPVSGGRSIAVIIEGAVTNLILRSRGYDSNMELEDRVLKIIEQQKGKGV